MPNKKQLKWWSLATAIVLTALSACTNDNGQATTNTADNSAISALRQATGLTGQNTISIPKNPGTAQRSANGTYEMTDFLIDMDQVKRTAVDEKLTYSFSIVPKVVTSKSDYNLIVYNNGSGWEYSIMELVRDPETTGKFTGSMKELYSSTARGSGCVTIFMEYNHCTHTGECASGTCDRCSLCVDYDSLTFCKIEAEPYLTATLVETPNYGGGGGTVHTEPQHVDVEPGGYIFEPNIRENALTQTRKERAADFYNALTPEQKQWAEAHPDSYHSLLKYLLDNYTPENDIKVMELVALAAADGGTLTVDESVTADDAMVFNTVEDFQQFLEEEIVDSEEYAFDPSQRLASSKSELNSMIDLNYFVKTSYPPFHVDNVTSNITGLTLFYSWSQLDYSVTDMGDNVKIDIYGTLSVKVIVDGIGTLYEHNVHIELNVVKTTGKINATIVHRE